MIRREVLERLRDAATGMRQVTWNTRNATYLAEDFRKATAPIGKRMHDRLKRFSERLR